MYIKHRIMNAGVVRKCCTLSVSISIPQIRDLVFNFYAFTQIKGTQRADDTYNVFKPVLNLISPLCIT